MESNGFNKRMFDPEKDVDVYGDIKDDGPKKQPNEIFRAFKRAKERLKNDPSKDEWTVGLEKNGRGFQALVKKRF